jgi:hypothetical protein
MAAAGPVLVFHVSAETFQKFHHFSEIAFTDPHFSETAHPCAG